MRQSRDESARYVEPSPRVDPERYVEMLTDNNPPIVWLIGVAHYDVCGRGRLLEALNHLRDTARSPPSFVGVEYAMEEVARRRRARLAIREQLLKRWSDLSEGELDQISRTYGYDGDAHPVVYPDVPTVFLEEGYQDDVGDSAENVMRIQICGCLWRLPESQEIARAQGNDDLGIELAMASGCAMPPDGVTPAGNLQELSRACWDMAEQARPIRCASYDRDQRWREVVLRQLPLDAEGWAIIIVGNDHIRRDRPGNLYELLTESGYHIETRTLRSSG
jgi:hypothetical protein